ncbi:MAG: glycosyltransferase family 4 protein [Spirulina sp. SIO3F2]|nr:glycosyltransferase family 4 protein [Spirulina sp. SIO3F2]
MRILIYSYNYSPEPIGIGPLMTELAEGLASRGHQVRVVTAFPWYPVHENFPRDWPKGLYTAGERNQVWLQRCWVYISKKRSLLNRGLFELSFMFLSFFQALRHGRPDVVLLTVPGLPVGISAAIIGWLFRCPIVLNLQDILPDAAIEVGLLTNRFAIFVFKALEKYNYWIAERITVISDGFMENLHSKDVNLSKVHRIYNWVDIELIKPIAPEINTFRNSRSLQHRFETFVQSLTPQEKPAFKADSSLAAKFIVLYSGNIGLTQPMDKVLQAAKLLEAIPDIHFVIVGPQDGLTRLWHECQTYQVRQNITLSPFVDRQDLPMLLTAANVSLVVQKKNVISFNMPSKIQTISASGRPIIASVPQDGTAAQAILNSGGGIWVPPEDPKALAQAIEQLYRDPDEVQRLGAQARRYAVEHYSYQRALDRYEALFQEVRSPHRKPSTYSSEQGI